MKREYDWAYKDVGNNRKRGQLEGHIRRNSPEEVITRRPNIEKTR